MNSVSSINIIVETDMDKKDVGDNAVEYLKNSHKDLNGIHEIQDSDEITKAFSKIVDVIAE